MYYVAFTTLFAERAEPTMSELRSGKGWTIRNSRRGMTFTKKNSCKGNLSKKKFLQTVMPKKGYALKVNTDFFHTLATVI